MGTIAVDETPKGCLYLNRRVFEQFDEVKTQCSYDTNQLLEHLISLYCKQAGETRGLPVRLDLALKFCSLQALTPFENSNDLMTHLLSIHSSHENNPELAQPSNEKTEQSKPKKNKRKPDFVQRKSFPAPKKKNSTGNSAIDFPVNRSRSPSVNFSDDSGCFDTSKDEVKGTLNGSSPDRIVPYTEMTGLDLSIVKKEKGDNSAIGGKRSKSVKDHANTRPVTSHPAEAVNSQAKWVELESSVSKNQLSSINFQPTWRSNSVPVGDYNPSISPKQPLSLQSSPQGYNSLDNLAQNNDRKNRLFLREASPIIVDVFDVEKQAETENYNYVLNSLDSPGSPVDVERVSPNQLKMPVKSPMADHIPFSNSDKHSRSPEDLSLTVPLRIVEDEPQDLTSPQKTHPATQSARVPVRGPVSMSLPTHVQAGKQNHIQNMPPLHQGNRLIAPAVFKEPKSLGLIGEPKILTFPQRNPPIQPKLVALPVNPGSQQIVFPTNAQQNVITLSPAGPPPKLIPASATGGPPLQTSNGSSTSGNPIASTVFVPISPDSSQNSQLKLTTVPNGAVMMQFDLNDDRSKARRKRRKMEDTTNFRDPPESSLPFNGPNKFRFYCDVCDTGFTRRYTYNRHRCKGKVEKHYCQLCDKAYLSKYKLKDHILVKHEGQTVSCPDCGKRFSSRSSMEMHKKQQHEGQFSIFCKICGKGFNHTGHYYGHMNKHTNTKPFWCQKCGKRFYGSSYLHNHKQVCRAEEDWQHQCSICERKFKCELYLKKHMKVHDSTPILYQQSLDSNQNEVTTAVSDADMEKMDPKVDEAPHSADADKLGTLNSVFHNNGQVQGTVA